MDKIERIGISDYAIVRINWRIEKTSEKLADLDRQGRIYEGAIRSDFTHIPYYKTREIYDSVKIIRIAQ